MATEPNTTIKLYSGIPFSVNYEHTMYFANATAQVSFFAGFTPLSFTEQSYQRVNKNTLRIQASAESLMSYNYMSITNNNHGGRTYYAFIVDVPAYINENTCEITYEIDVIQSYLFHYTGVNNRPDITVKGCFIEREHSNTDGIGDNIVTEPVGLGEYVFANYDKVDDDLEDMCVIVAVTDVNGHADGQLYNGMYGGCALYVFDMSLADQTALQAEITALNQFIDSYEQKPDAIVGMYMCPKTLIPAPAIANRKIVGILQAPTEYMKLLPKTSSADDFGGFLPINMKLYTYPYNFLHIDNGQGDALSLRYEFFSPIYNTLTQTYDYTHCSVIVKGLYTQPVNVQLTPTNYKGVTASYGGVEYLQDSLLTECISLDNYPMCSWNYDSFSSWCAQNTIPSILNMVSGLGNTAISSVYSAHPTASVGTGLLGQITGLLSNIYTASIKADVCRGKSNNAGGGVSYRTQQFFYGRCHINRKDAEIIDDFFSVYGYATNLIKVPNLFAGTYTRPNYYYVKTAGCDLLGHVNSAIVKKVGEIFDNGITFWLNYALYGDYTLAKQSNVPTSNGT